MEEEDASVPHSTPGTRDRTGESVVLHSVTLADLCRRHSLRSIDLMKMDLEGLEQPLLTGQEEFWAGWPPRHLIVEVTLGKSERQAPGRLFEAMAKRGYRHRRLEGLHAIPWFQREDLANWYFWKAA